MEKNLAARSPSSEHQFKVANDLGDASFWVSPKFSFMKNLSQSIAPNPMFFLLLLQQNV